MITSSGGEGWSMTALRIKAPAGAPTRVSGRALRLLWLRYMWTCRRGRCVSAISCRDRLWRGISCGSHGSGLDRLVIRGPLVSYHRINQSGYRSRPLSRLTRFRGLVRHGSAGSAIAVSSRRRIASRGLEPPSRASPTSGRSLGGLSPYQPINLSQTHRQPGLDPSSPPGQTWPAGSGGGARRLRSATTRRRRAKSPGVRTADRRRS